MYIKKIVTHSGMHHADELLAITMVRKFVKHADKADIERVSEVPEKYLKNKEVIVIDVGRSYNAELHNFDHHHDPSLPASCILVGREICPETIYPYLERYLLGYVSDVDTGKIWSDFPSINNILRNYETFDDALLVASIIFGGYLVNAYKAIESERKWEKLEKLNGIAINREKGVILNWKSIAKKEGVFLMITPSDRNEGWNVIVRDSDIIKLLPDENQMFLHNEGFMAVYKDFETALEKAVDTMYLFNLSS
ncbi:MAG: MYG1 family protein [Alkalibacterium sp.]|uniref:MYG1 family protein n=1 Tax=Alkalibacterium sp. TaxID=1872447 RepID=UPI003970D876